MVHYIVYSACCEYLISNRQKGLLCLHSVANTPINIPIERLETSKLLKDIVTHISSSHEMSGKICCSYSNLRCSKGFHNFWNSFNPECLIEVNILGKE